MGKFFHTGRVASMMVRPASEPVYSIGAVARMLGVTTPALRAWEERYRVVVPARSGGDQRLYSRDEVDQLRFVERLMKSGLHAADAHRVLAQRLQEGMTLVPDAEPRSGVSILLAERDIYSAQMIEYVLRTEGYQVTVALDAPDALEIFGRTAPDLVILELVISGGVGVKLCRELADRGARIIAISSLAVGDAAIEAGAEAFLRKPLDPLQALSTARDLLGTSALVADRRLVRQA
jgi:DNA-binding transcriptional MerR regulator